jgi:hypothetical protein
MDELARLAPTGAPAVGAPPVAVAAVLRAAGVDHEAAVTRARRAFPGLSEEEVRAAFAVDIDDATPTPAWPDALALAVPLGLGALWASYGLAVGASALLGGVLPLLLGRGGAGADLVGVLLLGGLACLLGASLVRLDRRARLAAAALHAFVPAAIVAFAAVGSFTRDPPLVWALPALTLGLLAGGLAHPRTGAWFEPAGRAAVGAVTTRPYLAAVAGAQVVVGVLVFVVPAFGKMFKEVGLSLPVPTESTLALSELCRTAGWLVAPALVFAPAPLLRQPRRRESALLGAVALGAFVAIGSIGAALFLPLLELTQKL